MTSIPLYLNAPHSCSYLEDKSAQFAYVHPDIALNTTLYEQLIEQGFRRSGNHVYRPYCTNCTHCISTRLAVEKFKPSRQQRRTFKKNTDLKITLKPALFEQAHFDLYQHYQRSRHAESDMANTTPDEYINFLKSDWCNTLFIEFTLADELAGVAIVDLFDNALSAVYTFFDPKFSARSLGVYAVLWQIEHAKTVGLDWVYLGYWIKECQKMSYKTNYQPIQGFINNEWHDLKSYT